MSKNHFIALANEFKEARRVLENTNKSAVEGLDLAIDGFILVAKNDNPLFDENRFRKACGQK